MHGLFYDSLERFGILALGPQGVDRRSPAFASRYEAIDAEERIYRKVS